MGREDLEVIPECTGSTENVLGSKSGAWAQMSGGIVGVM